MTKILSIDVSSTTIGLAVLQIDSETSNIALLSVQPIKPTKKGDIISRLADTKQKIKSLIEEVKPDYIIIEDIVQFMAGKSTAKTIITLTSFNRMVGLISYEYLGHSPELLSVMTIRHGLKIDKIFPSKEEMPELIAHHLNIPFPYLYNKKGKIRIESYDCADAIAVGLYFAQTLTGKIKRKIKKVKTK
jgi:Holliday junction resolvasome RuvABC endonuclease subunit